MTDVRIKDPARNIMVKGKEVPRIVDNGDGTVTWNLKSETATSIATMLLANVFTSLTGDRKRSSNGLSDLFGGKL